MKACNDINFLSNYWIEAKNIAHKIAKEMPQIKKSNVGDGKQLMYIVNFSDISGKSWSVKDVLNRLRGRSETLTVLADKIRYMIHQGRSNDVKPMLEKIITGRIKKLSKKPNKHDSGTAEFLGHGHFRWNNSAYVLDHQEINHIKRYFELN